MKSSFQIIGAVDFTRTAEGPNIWCGTLFEGKASKNRQWLLSQGEWLSNLHKTISIVCEWKTDFWKHSSSFHKSLSRKVILYSICNVSSWGYIFGQSVRKDSWFLQLLFESENNSGFFLFQGLQLFPLIFKLFSEVTSKK